MTAAARRAVIALTGAALFMIVLDNLIVLATLPSIQRSLHASLTSMEWVVDAYILSFAVLMLTGAALGERFGRRRVFMAGLVVFTAASAVAGFAPSASVLIGARVVQGVGGALVMPLTLTLLSAAFAPEHRASALGMWSAVAGLGVALGPIAGGLLAEGLSWHWIFWVNIPVGALVVALSPRVLAESRGRPESIDLPGLALVSAGLLGVVWATVRGNAAGWGSPQTVGAYVAGALLLGAFVLAEWRSTHPMLPLRLFADRRFSIANASGFMLHFAMFGTFFLVIQFLAQVRHESPVMAGVWTLPWTVMPLLVSPLAGRMSKRFAPAALVAAGLSLVTLGIGLIAATLTPSSQPLALVGPLDIGKASGTLNTARQLGSVFGIAVPVAVFELAGSYGSAASAVDGIGAALVTTAASAGVGALLVLRLVPLGRLRLSAARAA